MITHSTGELQVLSLHYLWSIRHQHRRPSRKITVMLHQLPLKRLITTNPHTKNRLYNEVIEQNFLWVQSTNKIFLWFRGPYLSSTARLCESVRGQIGLLATAVIKLYDLSTAVAILFPSMMSLISVGSNFIGASIFMSIT